MRRYPGRGAFAVGTLFVLASCAAPENVPPARGYQEVAQRLTAAIEHEMDDKDLPAFSIVLVDDQEVVWAQGFGYEDPDGQRPATAATVYRVGSVSKLFTDIGIMQLVERGELDLDAPVTRYLPDFKPENGFNDEVPTLRQLTSHRAGLVREPPAGHYFDDTGIDLATTVRSLNTTSLVYPPRQRTKYSNAGIAVVGYVLERTQGTPFPVYLSSSVLQPLGMTGSSFQPEPAIVGRLATAYMWTYDGRTFEAPTFQLGMAPAGSMYAPVTDLARFMSALFAGGEGENARVIGESSLREMWTPQFAPEGSTTGYGIGFRLGTLDGERSVGHGGAIYGFATDLAALPDRKLGVASVTTMDGANTVVSRVDQYALRLMVAAADGAPLPEFEVTSLVPDSVLAGLGGRYGLGDDRIDVTVRKPNVVYATFSSRRLRLRWLDGVLITDDRLGYGTRMVPLPGALVIGSDTLVRQPDRLPAPAPARWRGLIGEYGWDHNTLYIYEDRGQLHALIEWFFIDPLTEVSEDVFAFPDSTGLYYGERLAFSRGPDGRATRVMVGGVPFLRRAVGTESGETFTIEPIRPVAELREAARQASPPVESGDFLEPDLVELRSLDSTIRYDIRYATTNNFMQSVFYDEARAFLQRPAAEALVRAHRRLRSLGYGLLIHDAYRPWYVTRMFWDATPDSMKDFVANPASGSRHNRGAAVDLTLFDAMTGEPIEMVGGYDEFSDRSFPEYPGGTERQRWHRELLRSVMEDEGFDVYEYEWWHFDYGDWSRYAIQNVVFSEIR